MRQCERRRTKRSSYSNPRVPRTKLLDPGNSPKRIGWRFASLEILLVEDAHDSDRFKRQGGPGYRRRR